MDGTMIKIGDLVKRRNGWTEWTKHNPWMLDPSDQEIGIIIEFQYSRAFIYWPKSGGKYEDPKNLILITKY